MDLNPEQQAAVAQWVADGVSLSDVQKRIQDEFGIVMTYMDVRFLVIDLGVEPQDKPEPKSAEPETPADPDAPVEPDEVSAPGGLSLDVDAITKPGAVVSGTVVFSDGIKASWFLDQSGRLGLDAGDPGYKPSEDDLQVFQEQLRGALEKRGF
jgi:hypothetical protein